MIEMEADAELIAWPIELLVPHSGLMLLLDEAGRSENNKASAMVRIADDSMFCEPGRGVPAWVGIEYMAQTVAMFGGLRSREAGQKVEKGLLVGTRRYRCSVDYFAVGSRLSITVEEELLHGPAGVFSCTIARGDGEVLAEARLNVYVPADQSSLAKGQF